jgi:hypothetical protein
MTEIYISTDVETDGPIPGPHSMLSFASAAYTEDKQLVSTFSANLEALEGAWACRTPPVRGQDRVHLIDAARVHANLLFAR